MDTLPRTALVSSPAHTPSSTSYCRTAKSALGNKSGVSGARPVVSGIQSNQSHAGLTIRHFHKIGVGRRHEEGRFYSA